MGFIQSRWLCGAILALVLFSIHVPVSADTPKQTGDKAAVVNGEIVTFKDYSREIKIFRDRLAKKGNQISDTQLEAIKPKILESLIEQTLLLQESRKLGVMVLPEEIEKQFATVRNRYPTQAQFVDAISRIGLTEDELKQRLTRTFTINLFINTRIVNKIEVSEKDARDYYESHRYVFKKPVKYRVSHILIKLALFADEETTKNAEKTIKMIEDKLASGEDFAELARQYSEDVSRAQGGDLGYIAQGDMVKSFTDLAFDLEINEVSDVVQTIHGLHLIKMLDKKPEIDPPFEDVKDRIYPQVRKERVQKALRDFVVKLKGTAKIERFIEN